MKDKLEQIDEILASYEDWMHGTDGDNCTKARKLLIEVMTEVKNISLKKVTEYTEGTLKANGFKLNIH